MEKLTYEELQEKFESSYIRHSIDISKNSCGEYVSMATFHLWNGYRFCAEDFGIFDLKKYLKRLEKERKAKK